MSTQPPSLQEGGPLELQLQFRSQFGLRSDLAYVLSVDESDVENTRARDLVDLAWFAQTFSFRSDALIDACVATFERRATHPWPPMVPAPPVGWRKPYARWRAELDLSDPTPEEAIASVTAFLDPVFGGIRDRYWDPETRTWSIGP